MLNNTATQAISGGGRDEIMYYQGVRIDKARPRASALFSDTLKSNFLAPSPVECKY
jgi:hypothetical protein